MATIFKRKADRLKRGSRWVIGYVEERGRRRTRVAYTDKGETREWHCRGFSARYGACGARWACERSLNAPRETPRTCVEAPRATAVPFGETRLLANRIEDDIRRRRDGMTDYSRHLKRPLAEHLDEYEAHLQCNPRVTSVTHIEIVVPRIRRVLEGCGFVYWRDVHPSAVTRFIADLKAEGLSAQTRNPI